MGRVQFEVEKREDFTNNTYKKQVAHTLIETATSSFSDLCFEYDFFDVPRIVTYFRFWQDSFLGWAFKNEFQNFFVA